MQAAVNKKEISNLVTYQDEFRQGGDASFGGCLLRMVVSLLVISQLVVFLLGMIAGIVIAGGF